MLPYIILTLNEHYTPISTGLSFNTPFIPFRAFDTYVKKLLIFWSFLLAASKSFWAFFLRFCAPDACFGGIWFCNIRHPEIFDKKIIIMPEHNGSHDSLKVSEALPSPSHGRLWHLMALYGYIQINSIWFSHYCQYPLRKRNSWRLGGGGRCTCIFSWKFDIASLINWLPSMQIWQTFLKWPYGCLLGYLLYPFSTFLWPLGWLLGNYVRIFYF